jgi:hypothetical protein
MATNTIVDRKMTRTLLPLFNGGVNIPVGIMAA